MTRSAWALVVLVAAALVPSSGWSTPGNTLPSDAGQARVLLIGDSFVAQTFGRALKQELSEAGFAVSRRGKHSSGLARPDFFDWWREGSRLVARDEPTLIIVMMGGNDGQDLLNQKGKGRVRWGEVEWEERYAARVESFLNALGAGPRMVLWLELPPMHTRRFERKVEYIRRIQRRVLTRIPSTQYVQTADLLPGLAGTAVRRCSSVGATRCAVHDPDGVHLTPQAGWAFAQLVASRILPEMRQTDRPSDDALPVDVLEDERRRVPEPASDSWEVSEPLGYRGGRLARGFAPLVGFQMSVGQRQDGVVEAMSARLGQHPPNDMIRFHPSARFEVAQH
jgi:uncharacterized protein